MNPIGVIALLGGVAWAASKAGAAHGEAIAKEGMDQIFHPFENNPARFEVVPMREGNHFDVYDLKGKDPDGNQPARQYILSYDRMKNIDTYSADVTAEQQYSAMETLGLTA